MTTLYVLDSNMLIYYLNASLTESVIQGRPGFGSRRG